MSDEIKIQDATKELVLPLKFIFDKAAGLQIHSADGCWVEAGRIGKLILNFYIERAGLPQEVIYDVNQDGALKTGIPKLPEEIAKDKSFFVMHREILSTIVLSVDGARQLRELLDNFIEGMKQFDNGSNNE